MKIIDYLHECPISNQPALNEKSLLSGAGKQSYLNEIIDKIYHKDSLSHVQLLLMELSRWPLS